MFDGQNPDGLTQRARRTQSLGPGVLCGRGVRLLQSQSRSLSRKRGGAKARSGRGIDSVFPLFRVSAIGSLFDGTRTRGLTQRTRRAQSFGALAYVADVA